VIFDDANPWKRAFERSSERAKRPFSYGTEVHHRDQRRTASFDGWCKKR
jgi:hypothetical protein